MERYHVKVTDRATEDILSIGAGIAESLHQPDTAAKVLTRIYKEIDSLEYMPERYALSTNSRYAKKGYRVTSAGKYLIFYRVDKPSKTVEVLNVLHGSRNMSQWL